MIFIGDIAVPDGITPTIDDIPACFFRQSVIANLEGAIIKPEMANLEESKLFCSVNVIPFLKALNVKAVSLANNHITDVPEAFEYTKHILDENEIAYFGAGYTLEEAQAPAIIEEYEEQYILFGFGWDVISCKYAGKHSLGVNPLTVDNVLSCIKKAKIDNPNGKIIILPHWDYELEQYPMPMHRELAKIAIEAGADAVIGHHPHCVQGIELYKRCPIIYSLGNWLLPDNIFMGGKLVFPQYAKLQMAVEITGKNVPLHWFEYDANKHGVNFIGSEELLKSNKVTELTPFKGLSQTEYIKWFRKYRVKKRLLPIFVKSDSSFSSKLKVIFVKIRHEVIKFALKRHLINRGKRINVEKISRDQCL